MNGTPRRKWLRWLLWSVAVLVGLPLLSFVGRMLYAFRDRQPGYSLSLSLANRAVPGQVPSLRVGFARTTINPDLSDTNHPIWIAGFSQHRAATKVHDDLMAIACVLDDGQTRLGIVALDAIGFFHDDVVAARRRLAREWRLDYTIICATHNHSTPDLMGLWGPDYLHTGVDPRYREQVVAACVKTLGEAVVQLQPARVTFHQIPTPTAGLVADTRKPVVFDPDIRVMHFLGLSNATTLGSLVTWSDHPETPWSHNTELTADYCGYLRSALENGVRQADQVLAAGVGGTHLYINGAIGGLISTTPDVTVQDPYLKQDFKEPSHDKARALGRQLASRILPQLLATQITATALAPLSIRARTLEIPIDNASYLAAGFLGLIDRGHSHWRKIRSEVALITFGEAAIACVPGELYPEIANGGIERPEGGDFPVDPVEVPPLRQFMPGKVQFLFGLANDEIGYLIPKSEWDQQPPYLYGAARHPYGEVNSCSPDAAGLIHAALLDQCGKTK